MKILSFHPCPLYTNGGAGRLMRRLCLGKEDEVTAMFVKEHCVSTTKGKIREIAISAFPKNQKWTRWKLRMLCKWLRENIFFNYTKKRILKKAVETDFDVLHIINHGVYSAILCNNEILKNRKLWTSFHDHYSLCSNFCDTNKLWNSSERRFVISEELGREYQKIFGNLSYEIITDGLFENEISQPKTVFEKEIIIYFSGLLHFDYLPIFKSLADALDCVNDSNITFRFIMRGTQKLDFFRNRNFPVEYRNDFVSDNEILKELNSADILYLPIKDNKPAFYMYSLSTKMVGYTGAAGTILYHGPKESAANRLLEKYDAAVSCFSFDKSDIINSIHMILNNKGQKSSNAKRLAKEKFNIERTQNIFWQK
ncbi:MAG: hypothetical protein LBG92_03395 [Prevotellaceae bacterium]|jgi:hypothetical protein|nr:hypothetical protein [Prevotellaceae bacterium]